MSTEVVGFDKIKKRVMSRLGEITVLLKAGVILEIDGFLLHEGNLFRFHKLCIPRTSLRDYLVWELHVEGLAGHFGREKTIEAMDNLFYWPSPKKDVAKLIRKYHTCQLAKQRKQNTGDADI